ncbi:MAG: PAS domain S-box protein [Acidobacteriota bacterium]
MDLPDKPKGERETQSRGKLLAEIRKLRDQVKSLSQAAADREQTREALRISEEVFRQIFEEGPVAMHLVSPSFHLLRVNAAMCRMLGYSREELIGRPLDAIIHPEDVEIGLNRARSMRAGEIPSYQLQRRYLRKDGEVIWTRLRASIIRDRVGKPLYGIGVVENVTAQKHADEVRLRLEEQLRHAQKMEAIGKLAGSVAHDFNNLLTAILGNVVLMRSLLEQEQYRHAARVLAKGLEEIERAGDHATSLTRQLLTFSRKDVTKPEVLDLNRIIDDMETMLARLCGEHIELEIDLDRTAPPIHADAGQIEQVILNLALNARDAMPSGGRLRLESAGVNASPLSNKAEESSRFTRLTIRDTGVGMSEETLQHIFEPFFTTKPLGKGTGLGLSTVYGIITRAGGHIKAESKLHSGSSFRVYLPASSEPVAELESGSRVQACRGDEVVLVCEDDAQVREVICQVLLSGGYQVIEEGSSKKAVAVAAASKTPIDLLVADVIMPEMNGKELAQEVTALHPHMRVLFISGYSAEILDPQGIRQGSLEFLAKPFAPSALLQRVRQVLDKDKPTSA